MAPRRVPRRRVTRVTTRGRVSRPVNPQQWEKTLQRAGSKLVLVVFTTDVGRSGHRTRTMLAELAGQADYKNVEFVLVDLGKAMELAEQEGINGGVVVAIYQNRELIEKSRRPPGEHPGSQVFQYLSRHVGRVNAEIAEQNKLRRRIMYIGGTILAIMSFSAGVVAYVMLQQESMSDDEIEDEDDFFAQNPSQKKPLATDRWWSGDEEESGYDHWSEYVDSDRDNFDPFPIAEPAPEASE